MTHFSSPSCEILLPVFNGITQVQRCLASLERHLPADCQVHLLDDASTDARLLSWLDELDGRLPWLRISRFEINLGFVGNVNRALAQARTDVVLLNSDTQVTPGWLERLRRCAASDPNIGIVCPLSNHATILSVPEMNWNNPLPAGLSIDAYAALVADCAQPSYPRLPVAVGFCMLIRHQVLARLGPLDRAFQLGYGEECDFSLKAWEAGFQVVCCDDAFVYHQGEQSFAAIAEIEQVRARNAALLETRWPFYTALIQAWCQHNPLREVQERLHTALCEARGDDAPHVLYVIHAYDSLGGTELHSRWMAEQIAGDYRITVLYPGTESNPYRDLETQEGHEFVRLLRAPRPEPDTQTPEVRILGARGSLREARIEQQMERLIRAGQVRVVHFQHLLHWGSLALPMIAKSLGARVVMSLHDYFLFCPVFDLLDRDGRACGRAGADPTDRHCQSCLSDHSDGTLSAEQAGDYLRERRALLDQVFAASDVLIAPSDYVREKFAALYGTERAAQIRVIAHGLPALASSPHPGQARSARRRWRLGIFANLTRRKGAEPLLAAVRLLKNRSDVEWVHHGGVEDSYRQALDASGIFQAGPYQREHWPQRAAQTDLAIIPSIYEETYCLTIAELQSLGVPVVAFRVGAIAERIADGETGFLVDARTPQALAQRIQTLLGAPALIEHVRRRLRGFQPKTLAENGADYAKVYATLIAQPVESLHLPAELLPQERPATALKAWLPHAPDPLFEPGPGYDDAPYRRWLAQPGCVVPTQGPEIRAFAQHLEIVVVDLDLTLDHSAETGTLRSLTPALGAGAQVAWIGPDARTPPWKVFACCAPEAMRYEPLPPDSCLARHLNLHLVRSARAWILLLIAGTELHAHALPMLAQAVQAHPEWRLIYADDDWIAADGRRYHPRFKPDFNLDLIRCQDIIGSAGLIARQAFCTTAGFHAFPEAALYEMSLQLLDSAPWAESSRWIGHLPHVLFHYHDHPALLERLKGDDRRSHKALAAHLERRRLHASVQATDRPGLWWVDYHVPAQAPFSLIILTRGAGREVAATIDNLRSVAKGFEVLVVDFKGSGAVWPQLRQHRRDMPVRVQPVTGSMSLAQALNRALHACRHDRVLLTHDGMRFHRHGMVANLLGILARPEVALVGPCITDTAGRILHSYPVSGFWPFGATGQLHAGETLSEAGFLRRNLCMQNCITLSERFLALRPSMLLRQGGFCASRYPHAWFMLDLGLRLADAGALAVWTPHAVVVETHEGSLNRWRRQSLDQFAIAEEVSHLYEHWLPRLARDPGHNPQLSLRGSRASLELALKPRWDPQLTLNAPPLRVLGFPGDRSGSGHYRVIDPLAALEEQSLACSLIPAFDSPTQMPMLTELERLQPSAVLLHNALHDEQLHALALYRQYSDARLILSLDDLITDLPAWNPFRDSNYPDLNARLDQALAHCDRLIVSTQPLADALAERHQGICVLPNRLRASRWLALAERPRAPREPGQKPRIGWAGAPQHEQDLAWLAPVVESLAEEVEWYFFGMCPEVFKPFVKSFCLMVDFPEYPHRLDAMALDLAIAPLVDHPFNRCKSHLKILEHGILGTAVICSDIAPYRHAPVTRLANEVPLWRDALRERISDLNATHAEGERLQRWVRDNGLLESNLDAWQAALS